MAPDKRGQKVMSKTTIRLKEKKPDLPPCHLKLRLSGQLAADVEAYRMLYAEVHGRTIELGQLIEGILEQFLDSDREFQRRKQRGVTGNTEIPADPNADDCDGSMVARDSAVAAEDVVQPLTRSAAEQMVEDRPRRGP